jgi:hypothetical protein
MSRQSLEFTGPSVMDGSVADFDCHRTVLALVVITRAADGRLDAELSLRRGESVDVEELRELLLELALSDGAS